MKQFMLIATAFAATLHTHNQTDPSALERRLVPALRTRHPGVGGCPAEPQAR